MMKKIWKITLIAAAGTLAMATANAFESIDFHVGSEKMSEWKLTREDILQGYKNPEEIPTEKVRSCLEKIFEMDNVIVSPGSKIYVAYRTGTIGERRKIAEKWLEKLLAGTPIPPAGTPFSREQISQLTESASEMAKDLKPGERDLFGRQIAVLVRARQNQSLVLPIFSVRSQLSAAAKSALRKHFLEGETALSEADEIEILTLYNKNSGDFFSLQTEAFALTENGKILLENGDVWLDQEKTFPQDSENAIEQTELKAHLAWLKILRALKENPGVPAPADDYKNFRDLAEESVEPLMFPTVVKCAILAENWDDAAYFQYLWLRELPFGAGTQNPHWQKLFRDLMNFYANGGNAHEFFVCAGFCEKIGLDFPRERENALAGTLDAGTISAAKSRGAALAGTGFYENSELETRFLVDSGMGKSLREFIDVLAEMAEAMGKVFTKFTDEFSDRPAALFETDEELDVDKE